MDDCQTLFPPLCKMASSVTLITDGRLVDILPEIFIRLPTPADLIRTSVSCVSFRRLITNQSFLRRFRKLHTPPLLGFLDRVGFHPVASPYPYGSAAHATALVADFSFSFLPPPAHWTARDIRDGRVLLSRHRAGEQRRPVFGELAVCDPLHQRYILLPPIPNDVVISVEDPLCKLDEPFLAPHVKEELDIVEEEEEISFQVIWLASCVTKPVAFVFSSSSGQWRVTSSHVWSDLISSKRLSFMSSIRPYLSCRHYAYGCFYWKIDRFSLLLMLNTQAMEFSTIELPPDTMSCTIVEAGEGRLGMVNYEGNTSNLCYTIRQNRSVSSTSNQWQMEKTFSLGSGYKYYITGATERYVILIGHEDRSYTSSSMQRPDYECIALDVNTLKLDRICGKNSTPPGIGATHIYTNFPPLLLSSWKI